MDVKKASMRIQPTETMGIPSNVWFSSKVIAQPWAFVALKSFLNRDKTGSPFPGSSFFLLNEIVY